MFLMRVKFLRNLRPEIFCDIAVKVLKLQTVLFPGLIFHSFHVQKQNNQLSDQ